MADGVHVPVLLAEAVEALAIKPAGVYVDATFGRGGHARAILAALGPDGRLVAVDRDPAAAASAAVLDDRRFAFRRAWFSELPGVLAALRIVAVDGVLLDLGISSAQIDDAARGFSFRFDGPLDMRMDPSRGESAAEFIARATAGELGEVIRDYGEERFAQSIARAIAAARAVKPIVSTAQLAAIVRQAVGARTRGDWRQDPAARTFQALRIAVNRELHEVSITLPRLATLLAPRGRLAVISFHSLEDRIVKRFLAWSSAPWGGDPRLARVPIAAADLPRAPMAIVGRARKPSDAEVAANSRARSAVLRVGERTDAALPADWPRGFEGA
ncbi:MAG TPA: 16S rRNA (cytosine(1402)-N(4))-methyltransferase RsmH [Casimicrobiaceae bacterium]|nr:16S rRNA (cytosine(1402)-N(4))-methyltransferase RsmH [Casimicrobiaceae bacterium]